MYQPDFGVFLAPEDNSYTTLKSHALLCEDLGYHSLWISDRLLGVYQSPASKRLECWTTVSALAAITRRIRLGQITLATPFRPPSLLAKMAATLDVISDGRLELSLGAGWYQREFEAYGYPYGTWTERIGRFDEAAQIITKMWTEEAPSFQGKYYTIREAYCEPKPVQKPHPPLMIAGGGEQRTLRTVAKYADVCNFAAWMGTPDEYRHKLSVLMKHCEAVERNPEDIRKSWAAFVFINIDQEHAERKAKQYMNRTRGRSRTPILIGTPETITKRIGWYLDEGVTLFILSFLGGDYEYEATLFRDEVLNAFQ